VLSIPEHAEGQVGHNRQFVPTAAPRIAGPYLAGFRHCSHPPCYCPGASCGVCSGLAIRRAYEEVQLMEVSHWKENHMAVLRQFAVYVAIGNMGSHEQVQCFKASHEDSILMM